MNSNVSVIITSHNQEKLLPRCINSLAPQLGENASEIIVIDNACAGRTKTVLGSCAGNIRLHENDRPQGLAWNINKGAELAANDWIIQLNPDMVYHSGSIDEALRFIRSDPSIAVLGCQLLNVDHTNQTSYRKFTTVPTLLGRMLSMESWPVIPSFYRYRMMIDKEFSRPTDVDWIFGAFMLMNKSLFARMGGMDEQLFVYYTDVDFCYRCRTAGYRTVFFPDLKFVHEHQRTSVKTPFSAAWKGHMKSALYYFGKHGYAFSPLRRTEKGKRSC